MESLPPAGQRKPDMTQLFGEMGNPDRQELPNRAEAGRAEKWFMKVSADDAGEVVVQEEPSV